MTYLSFWLTPVESDGQVLLAIIDKLAEEYQTAKFSSHITVFLARVGVIDEDEIKEKIKKSIEGLGTFVVEVTQVGQSEVFFKTIYLELAMADELRKINESLRDQFGDLANYQFSPHISLIYKNSTEKERKQIISKLAAPKSVKVGSVGYHIVEDPTDQSKEAIESWRYIKVADF